MSDKGLYKEKQLKKPKNTENNNLMKQIEKMREQLNRMVVESDKIRTNEEVLEISKNLDKLIVEHLKMYNKT